MAGKRGSWMPSPGEPDDCPSLSPLSKAWPDFRLILLRRLMCGESLSSWEEEPSVGVPPPDGLLRPGSLMGGTKLDEARLRAGGIVSSVDSTDGTETCGEERKLKVDK